jgi:hypothetical protein
MSVVLSLPYYMKNFVLLITCMGLISLSSVSFAQTVTETSGIDFGVFALTDNSGINSLAFTWNEIVTADPEFIIITSPSRGEYAVSGFPALVPLSVVITNGNLTAGGFGLGEDFDVLTYDTNPLTTDALGAATLFVGGTLDTNGSGTMYNDGGHSDQVTITVSFP